jgi:hypothetical protein
VYFWNLTALKRALSAGPLSNRAAFRYIIATFAAYEVLFEVTAYVGATPDTVALIANVVILVFGSLVAYAANGGDHGIDFLGRYLALGWVLGVRFLAAIFLVMLAVMVVIAVRAYSDPAAVENPTLVETYSTGLGIMAYGVFYWRLAVHLRALPARSEGASAED